MHSQTKKSMETALDNTSSFRDGDMYLIDHVHPSIEGHQLIADLIASKLSLMGIVHPRPGWRERRDEVFRAQLESLGSLYYARGQQRLEVLRMWTQGKAGTQWSYEGKVPVFLSPPEAEDGREAQDDALPAEVPVPTPLAPAGDGSE